MRYLGGKSRIAKHIAPIVNAARTPDRPKFWDPFCGGLSMAVALAKHGPGIVSDFNPALIAEWERCGVLVFVSEYACPAAHDQIWERTYGLSMSAGKCTHTDRLFRVKI